MAIELVERIKSTTTDEEKDQLKAQMCEEVGLNYISQSNIVGDLGGVGASYPDYEAFVDEIMSSPDKDIVKTLQEKNKFYMAKIYKNYLGNPESENLERIRHYEKNRPLLSKCRVEDRTLYLPLSLVSSILKDEVTFTISLVRFKSL